jgi:FMN phosphatase YigB (HAD superfamily)
MSIKAVLLDLDNTMILFDEAAFYLRYMERIVPFFADLVPEDQFRDRLLKGIRGLLKNNGDVSNRQFFLDLFCDGDLVGRQAVWERFMQFYEREYEKVPVEATAPQGLEQVLDQLDAWGIELVVATNPLFPQIAQEKRLDWIGLDQRRFRLITHLDNMTYVKPRVEYYRQVSAMIGWKPEVCIMVGNDTINDMVAGTAGMTTYLTTEAGAIDYSAVTKGRKVRLGQTHDADFTGPLAELVHVVDRLRER